MILKDKLKKTSLDLFTSSFFSFAVLFCPPHHTSFSLTLSLLSLSFASTWMRRDRGRKLFDDGRIFFFGSFLLPLFFFSL